MRRSSLVPPLLAVATALFVALIAISVRANLRQIDTLHDAGILVTHTLEVQRQLDNVLLEITEAETGQRGYLLTGEESYLEPYEAARRQLDVALDELTKLTRADVQQRNRVTRLRTSANAKMAEIDQTIAVRRAGDAAAATRLVRTDQGQRVMESIRGIVSEIRTNESAILRTRQAETDRIYDNAYAGRVAAGVFSGTLLLLLAVLAGAQASIRARAARALNDEREQLRVTVGSIGDAVIATDTDGRVTLMNAVASSLTGWPAEEAIGKSVQSVFNVVDEQRHTPLETPLRRVLREGTPGRLSEQSVLIARDGTERPVDDSAAPIRGEGGGVLGAVLVFRDVGERRRQEQALRDSEQRYREAAVREQAARAQAEEANRIKDEFLAVLSHELRTPLNAVLGWTQILKSGPLPEATVTRALAAIKRNAEAQRRLVEDLLEVSRIVTGKFALECKPVEVRGVIAAAVDDVRPLAEAKELTIDVSLSAAPAIVDADVGRLTQVASNLLSNAVKFTPPGGKIDVASRVEESDVVLTVRDTGQGIAPEVLPHIFDRFRQGDGSATRSHGGLGLGLAIAKHIIERHGGAIHAASAGVGLGSEFVVRLPLMAAERERITSSGRHVRALPLTGVRVLVVDDQPDSRELLYYALERAGAEVVLADSGAEALTAIGREPPDILLTDLQMPEMDGFELLRRAQIDANGHVPLAIAITARARADDARDTAAAGFAAHVSKPIDLVQLTDTIRRLMDARGAVRS